MEANKYILINFKLISGIATVDLGANIDFLLESTNQRVGGLTLNTVLEFIVKTQGIIFLALYN